MALNTFMSLLMLPLLIFWADGSPLQHRSPDVEDLTKRIAGGKEVFNYTWPFLVMVESQNHNGPTFECGGSILSNLTVLTAAHCVRDTTTYYYVTAAEHDLTITTGLEQRVLVRKIDISHANGVALLHLNRYLRMTKDTGVGSIEFNEDSRCPRVSAKCSMSGWGRSGNQVNELTVPYQTNVTVLYQHEYCSNRPNKLCTLAPRSDGACLHDYGGPLVCDCGGKKKLAGVLRGTSDCNRIGDHIRVSFVAQWIKSKMQS